MKRNGHFTEEQANLTVVINGVKMTTAEYKKMKESKRTAAHQKKVEAYVKTLFPYIQKIVKHITVLQSLCSYYDYGHRWWGKKVDLVLKNPFIESSFLSYRISAYEFKSVLGDIEFLSKKNEKDIFQFIQKLSWKFDDARTHINSLTKAVDESHVCQTYAGERFISESKKKLGLEPLMMKTLYSMNDLNNLIQELEKIAVEGLGGFGYEVLGTGEIKRIA